MLLYQVTVSIQHTHETSWLAWMQDQHIQDVLDTGYFVDATMYRQIEPPAVPNASTYCISYRCPSLEALASYQREAAPALQADHTKRFQGHFTASRVILQAMP